MNIGKWRNFLARNIDSDIAKIVLASIRHSLGDATLPGNHALVERWVRTKVKGVTVQPISGFYDSAVRFSGKLTVKSGYRRVSFIGSSSEHRFTITYSFPLSEDDSNGPANRITGVCHLDERCPEMTVQGFIQETLRWKKQAFPKSGALVIELVVEHIRVFRHLPSPCCSCLPKCLSEEMFFVSVPTPEFLNKEAT